MSFSACIGCFFRFEHVLNGFEIVQGNGARCMDPLAFGVDDVDESIDVFSLRVLAERIDRALGVCRKDGIGQVGHHFGQCVFIAVERGVEQASLDRGVQEMAEDALLNADYAVVNFRVFWGAGEVESASLFLQMVIEPGRRIKCIGREDVFGKCVHRAFLVGESNWREWPGCAGLADDCAVNVNAADIT